MLIAEFLKQSEDFRRRELFKCCGSIRWVEGMLSLPETDSLSELLIKSEQAWSTCNDTDWREAFTCHPKIGDAESLAKKFASTAQWASGEQSGVQAATQSVITSLAEGNREYEEKFGFIFIVCATGKTAEEMLELLRLRLTNAPDVEIRIAAQEQLKITQLRLQKLFTS